MGDLANLTKYFFEEEISWRNVKPEIASSNETFNYDNSPVTKAYQNFEEGFKHVVTLNQKKYLEIKTILCIDLTKRKVKNSLIALIQKVVT